MTALGAVGAEPGDVVRAVIYVVSDDTAVLGVARLGFRGQLVEVDLTAALPG